MNENKTIQLKSNRVYRTQRLAQSSKQIILQIIIGKKKKEKEEEKRCCPEATNDDILSCGSYMVNNNQMSGL